MSVKVTLHCIQFIEMHTKFSIKRNYSHRKNRDMSLILFCTRLYIEIECHSSTSSCKIKFEKCSHSIIKNICNRPKVYKCEIWRKKRQELLKRFELNSFCDISKNTPIITHSYSIQNIINKIIIASSMKNGKW